MAMDQQDFATSLMGHVFCSLLSTNHFFIDGLLPDFHTICFAHSSAPYLVPTIAPTRPGKLVAPWGESDQRRVSHDQELCGISDRSPPGLVDGVSVHPQTLKLWRLLNISAQTSIQDCLLEGIAGFQRPTAGYSVHSNNKKPRQQAHAKVSGSQYFIIFGFISWLLVGSNCLLTYLTYI